ncbi:hypothetical protein DFH06DRAFT_581428 [Mycena polygramma]|nr:hypothetical protein DFH06DRAFT_581428 [Mycena polygramma]
MPSTSATLKQNSLSEALSYATSAAAMLRDLSQASNILCLQSAGGGSLLVLNAINGMKMNQGMLSRIVELIHQLLCSVIHVCIKDRGVLPFDVLDHVAHFVKALQRIQTSVQLQHELGKIKRLIRQNELNIQLRAYEAELQGILDNFKMRGGASLAAEVIELELDAQQRHQELVTLLAQYDTSEYSVSFQGSDSSSVFPARPPYPKIFYGRQSELTQILTSLRTGPAYVAILGPGGMGKTTLAVAVLHDPEIISRYDQRHFISCESACKSSQLVDAIGARLGLEPFKDLSKFIVAHFLDRGSTLLVLDNLETAWEPVEGRAEVEELLSLLSEVPHLSLLITMRGAERPAKVKWTRPFLPPLEPLHPSASHQIFIDIADNPPAEDAENLTELVDRTGNLPLAHLHQVSLMATVASYEGYSNTLRRFKSESTALLSDGTNKKSNLEASIIVSLSSSRMLSSPKAKDLLSLLSVLPDGLSEVDLLSCNAMDNPNILQCRATLLRISLARMENDRLKVLSPIRQYMQRVHPPPHEAVERLRVHWDTLLTFWKSHKELQSGELVARLTSNLRNIDSVTRVVLSRTLPGAERQRLVLSVLSLDLFSQNILRGKRPLAQEVVDHIQSTAVQRPHWEHICSCLNVTDYHNRAPAVEALIQQGVQYYEQQDPATRREFYKVAARYHCLSGNLFKAMQFNQLGMTETEQRSLQEQFDTIGLTRRTSISHTISGQRLAEKQAAMYWTIASRLRHVSDLCKIGRDILVTYGEEGVSRNISMLDLEAGIKYEKSEYDEARALYEGVARMSDHGRHAYFHANALLNLVKIDQTTGKEEAVVLRGLKVARKASEHLNWWHGMLFCERLMAGVHLALGNRAAARKGYTECFESYRRAYMFPGMTQCLEMLGDPRYGMCDLETSFHWAAIYLATVGVFRDVTLTYHALRCLGENFLAQGDEETAINVFHAVLQGATEMDIHRSRAHCMSRIGDILMARGNAAEARRMWEEARPLFIRSSQLREATSLDVRLAQFVG